MFLKVKCHKYQSVFRAQIVVCEIIGDEVCSKQHPNHSTTIVINSWVEMEFNVIDYLVSKQCTLKQEPRIVFSLQLLHTCSVDFTFIMCTNHHWFVISSAPLLTTNGVNEVDANFLEKKIIRCEIRSM